MCMKCRIIIISKKKNGKEEIFTKDGERTASYKNREEKKSRCIKDGHEKCRM